MKETDSLEKTRSNFSPFEAALGRLGLCELPSRLARTPVFILIIAVSPGILG